MTLRYAPLLLAAIITAALVLTVWGQRMAPLYPVFQPMLPIVF